MPYLPGKLERRLQGRAADGSLRSLPRATGRVDFASNDYLGFARLPAAESPAESHGRTGSRLISGNHPLFEEAEQVVREFHRAEAALLYNSGYDANLGLLSAILQRGDYIFYDEAVHASIRDGIALGKARAFKFAHNDLDSLKERAGRILGAGRREEAEVYVVTESVFSMEGDGPELGQMAGFCHRQGYHLIVDEAHAAGVLGPQGRGVVVGESCQEAVFARVVTFGKALGCHGAAVLGSPRLRDFLVNFSRSLIYTTALPPAGVKAILQAYQQLQGPSGAGAQEALHENIRQFRAGISEAGLSGSFGPSLSAIHCCEVGGNERARTLAAVLGKAGFEVKPILPPTVPEGRACLRFSLHSFNTHAQVREVLTILAKALNHNSHE